MGVTCKFTADATTANRFIYLDIYKAFDLLLRLTSKEEVQASEDWVICWCAGGIATIDTTVSSQVAILPPKLLLNDQMTIESRTENMQVGDQFENVFMLVEEWIEPLA